MAAFGAVLDTCVLYPMPLADTLLLAAADGAYTFYWTADLLNELENVMVRQGRMPSQAARRVAQMRHMFDESQITGYRALINALMLPDPNDRHVLAAAVRAGVERIVTLNLAHFPPEVLNEYDIKAYHPDDFLMDLFELFPEPIVSLLIKQAGWLKKPPQTIDDILVKLENDNGVPRFVAAVRHVILHAP